MYENTIHKTGMIRLDEYAKSKGLSNVSLVRQARKGNFKTAKKISKRWYADKAELDARYYEYSLIPSDEYVTLKEYAELYELDYNQLIIDVRHGRYKTPIRNGKNWYIDKNEGPIL